LQRDYIKGRDWYDLYWYLNQPEWVSPNLNMLNSALEQSGWDRAAVTSDNWQSFVLDRLEPLDWDRVVDDVQRFLLNQQVLADFKKETIQNLLMTKNQS
jgi:hypothetical protein